MNLLLLPENCESTAKWLESVAGRIVTDEPRGTEANRMLMLAGGIRALAHDVRAAELAVAERCLAAGHPSETITDIITELRSRP